MINFFRKARKQSADDNKPLKYFRYAIGEIVLLVIGILIALSINTWNNERNNRIEEYQILEGLKNEFEYNLQALHKDLNKNRNVIITVDSIIALIHTNTLSNEPDNLDKLLVTLGAMGSFDARTGFIDEIISSGKLNLITNQQLKIKLTRWSGLLNDAKEDNKYVSDNYTHMLMPFLIKYFPLANGDLYKDLSQYSKYYIEKERLKSPFKSNIKGINLMEFENILWHHRHNIDYVELNDLEIEAFIKTTVEMITKEL